MISPESKEIGKIFREAREKMGLSVEEANERSRIHINVINDIESGVFDRLGKLYLRSFLKKYADFLKLDRKEMVEKFENVASNIPETEFDPDIKKRNEDREAKIVDTEKMIQVSLIGLFSVIFIVLVFILVGRVKSKFAEAPAGEETAAVRTERTAAPAVKKEAASRVSRAKIAPKPSPIAEVTLTLEARGEAWVKVMEGGNTLFVGILRRGNKKTFNANSVITIWTGRADMLDFTVNNRSIGSVAEGVVKNIKVSKEGITIDGNWVTRF
jgi:transcriptional regulator with XRE-family HTH domain